VEGRLAGVPTLFVLDTGAGTHTLAFWLAKKAGLNRRQTELKARDGAGRTLDVNLVHRVQVAIPGLGAFTLEDAIVAEFPPFFEEEGIGGALSPQLLAPRGRAVVLDMPASRARLEDAAGAKRAARSLPQSLAANGIAGCADLAAPLANFLFQVPVVVEGEDLLLTLDTGAGRTGIHEASAAGPKLKPRAVPRKGAASLGGVHEASSVQGVLVKAGTAEAMVEVDLVPAGRSRTCRADGLLGMDVLKQCVLVVSRSDFAGGCRP
jgi:predicted aspartyl protease